MHPPGLPLVRVRAASGVETRVRTLRTRDRTPSGEEQLRMTAALDQQAWRPCALLCLGQLHLRPRRPKLHLRRGTTSLSCRWALLLIRHPIPLSRPRPRSCRRPRRIILRRRLPPIAPKHLWIRQRRIKPGSHPLSLPRPRRHRTLNSNHLLATLPRRCRWLPCHLTCSLNEAPRINTPSSRLSSKRTCASSKSLEWRRSNSRPSWPSSISPRRGSSRSRSSKWRHSGVRRPSVVQSGPRLPLRRAQGSRLHPFLLP